MKIFLEFIGTLDIKDIENKSFIKIDDNSKVSDLMDFLKIQKEHQRFIIPYVNGEKKRLKSKINDNDKVKLYLPVGGG